MRRHALAIGLVLVCGAGSSLAQFHEEKLVKEYAKTLAKDRDPRDRASAAK